MKTGSPEFTREAMSFQDKESRLLLPTLDFPFPLLPLQMMFLFGFFHYGKKDILNRTYTRLFTFGSLQRMLRQAGFTVSALQGIPAPFPLAFGHNSWVGQILLQINQIMAMIWPSGFSSQMYCEAQPSPTLDKLLAWTLEYSIEVISSNEIVQC